MAKLVRVELTDAASASAVAARCSWGAFYYSGQACISVQRICVEQWVHAEFLRLLVENIKLFVIGDPMISPSSMRRSIVCAMGDFNEAKTLVMKTIWRASGLHLFAVFGKIPQTSVSLTPKELRS